MSYNRCHLVEEVERLRAKLMAGTMHQARWPGRRGHLHSRVGTGATLGPRALDPSQCVMHGNAPWGRKPCG